MNSVPYELNKQIVSPLQVKTVYRSYTELKILFHL